MRYKGLATVLAAICCLGGCSLLQPVGPDFLGEGGGERPAEESGAVSPGAVLEGVEGDVVHIPVNYITSPSAASAADPIYLQAVVETGDILVLQWSISNGKRGPTLLEGVSAATGQSLWRDEAQGYAYNTLPGESDGEFRVFYEDRVEYGRGDTGERESIALPASVRDALPADGLVAAPYDLLRGADIIAYCGEDGVYVCDLDGENARLAMPHSYLPGRVNYLGMDRMLEDYAADRLCYVAPQLMNGGARVAATAYLPSGGVAASRAVYVVAVDLSTEESFDYPDLLNPGALPAHRLGDDMLLAVGEDRFLRLTVSTGDVADIPFTEAEMVRDASWDYQTFARSVQEGERHVIRVYTPPGGEARDLAAVSGREAVGVWHMTERFLVCNATDADLDIQLFLIPYEN